MNNKYEIHGDITEIHLKHGKTIIDTEDLSKVSMYKGSWYITKDGYVIMNIGSGLFRRTYRMHRVVTDCPEHMVVDHKFGNKLDNRKSQLRIVTRAQNNQNIKGARKHSKTGVRGVSITRNGTYEAKIRKNGNGIYLGTYKTIREAEAAVMEGRKLHMPYSVE